MTAHIEPPPSLIEAREQRRRESRRKVLLGVVAIAAVVSVLTWLFAYSSVFVVKDVRIEGVSRLSPMEVDSSLGDVRGDKLALLDMGKLEGEVEAMPAVAGAEVSRLWPSGVRVAIDERPSLAVVSTSEGQFSLDDTGTLFTVPGVDPVGPAVSVESGPQMQESLSVVSEVLVALPKEVRDAVVSIHVPSPNDVQLELSGERTVVWGTPAKSKDKGEVLEVLLKQGGTWFDVSSPNLPVTRNSSPGGNSGGANSDGAGSRGATATSTSAPTTPASSGAPTSGASVSGSSTSSTGG